MTLYGTKILKSAFQSTTLRTAGFYTIPQNELSSASKLMALCYMFIGGSPASTAGGIKTVTLGVVILLVINYVRGKSETNIFQRNISRGAVKRAIVVFTISIFIIMIATWLLLITEDLETEQYVTQNVAEYINLSFMDVIIEVVSTSAT